MCCSSLYFQPAAGGRKRLTGVSSLSTKIVGIGFGKGDFLPILNVEKRTGHDVIYNMPSSLA